ncbi:MAG: hypothetical protein LBM77_03095 [Spirochaetaceae bacterium]|jgi:hypothetical protein|nr:hypothetical protein [Spirochaetaceae bacterium]
MGNTDIGAVGSPHLTSPKRGGINFLQSRNDFPMMVTLGKERPSWGFGRWKDEQGLLFMPPADEGYTLRGDTRQLLYKGRKQNHRFTILDDGNFEYDCILNKEPESNVIRIDIHGADRYDFYKQPEFVPDPLLKGSYAVYKKDIFVGDGTGKLCHIHRPLIIDAAGRKVWGDLYFDGKALNITIPEWWLSDAVYPVVVDPIVGTNTVGKQIRDPEGTAEDYLNFCDSIIVNRVQNNSIICEGEAAGYYYIGSHANYESLSYPALFDSTYSYTNGKFTLKPGQTAKNKTTYTLRLKATNTLNKYWAKCRFHINNRTSSSSILWFGVVAEEFYPTFDYGGECWCREYDVDNRKINLSGYGKFPWGRSYDVKISMYFEHETGTNHKAELYSGFDMKDKISWPGKFMRQVVQGLKINDTLKRFAGNKRSLGNSIKAFEGKKLHETFARKATDTIKGIAPLLRKHGLTYKFSEQLKAVDKTGRSGNSKRLLADNANNSSIYKHNADYGRKTNETIKCNTLVKRFETFVREAVDTIHGVTSSFRKHGIVSSITDNKTIRDIASRRWDSKRLVENNSNNTDSESTYIGYNRNAHDSIGVDSLLSSFMSFARKVIDAVSHSDFVCRFVDLFRNIIDVIKPMDSNSNKRDLARNVTDDSSVSVDEYRIFDAHREVTILSDVSDDTEHIHEAVRLLTKNKVRAKDTKPKRIQELIRHFVEHTKWHTATLASRELNRHTADTVGHTDAVGRFPVFLRLVVSRFKVIDNILSRFLKVNEELVVKSFICREVEIESRVH